MKFVRIPASLVILMVLLIPGAAMVGVGSGYPSWDPGVTHIAGHEIMHIRHSGNTPCYPSGLPPIVTLAADAPSIDKLLSSDAPDMAAIEEDLLANGFPDGTYISLTGPGLSKAMMEGVRERANATRREKGCIKFHKLDDAMLD